MKRRILTVCGSIGAGIVLMLSMMTPVVSAQTIKSNEKKTNMLQQINEKMKDSDWKPGDILDSDALSAINGGASAMAS